MSEKLRSLSLVIPLCNEADGVNRLFESLAPIINSIADLDWDIICVDDGSTDDTLENLQRVVSADPRVRVVELSRNFGKEAALTAGIDAAAGDAVILYDADLQDPPEIIPKLIAEWRNGYEVVLARRADRSSDSPFKRLTAGLFYRVHNVLAHVKIPENVGDFRLMDRIVVDALKRLPERQRFMKGLFAWLGFRTCAVEYSRPRRSTGKSKFTGWRLWNFALEGLTSFSTIPLRVWTYVGILCACLSLAFAASIVLRTILYGIQVPGYASIMVTLLFLNGLQLISVGLLGEYLGRAYIEAKGRPIYVIRRIHGAKREPHPAVVSLPGYLAANRVDKNLEEASESRR